MSIARFNIYPIFKKIFSIIRNLSYLFFLDIGNQLNYDYVLINNGLYLFTC